jgi:hypothetical protein
MMMANGIPIQGYDYIKKDAETLNIGRGDLHDRIINLKFIRASGDSFVVRSDFEPVFHRNGRGGSISFKKCVEKPDIKVSYKQVAQTTAIEVNIEVANLHFGDLDKEGMDNPWSMSRNPIKECIIHMGYRGQFPKDPPNIDDYYYMPSRGGYESAHDFYELLKEGSYGREIRVNILAAYPISYPPEVTIKFEGVIATLDRGLRWEHDANDLIRGYGDPKFPKKYSEIEQILFQHITRRFIRTEFGHRISDDKKKAVIKKGKKEVEITFTDKGIMTVEDALEYGVICAVSNTLRELQPNVVYGAGTLPEDTSNMRPIPLIMYDDLQEGLGGQLNAIRKHHTYLRWYMLPDGNFYCYHEKDTDEELFSDDYVKELQKKPIPLPAIYEMSPSGTRVISCPFVSFISPMSTVLFQSRYAIGTFVSFFYPVKTNAFLVIMANIEFATVQDINKMELTCVDQQPVDAVRNEKPMTPADEAVKQQKERNRQWKKRTITIDTFRTNERKINSSWEGIVSAILASANMNDFPNGLPADAELQALNILEKDNPALFDPNGVQMAKGNSIENRSTGIGGRTGKRVSWLFKGDTVIIRHPFLLEYLAEEEVV